MLTWSLGWTRRSPPVAAEQLASRGCAMTSLALVLVDVPEPVWKRSTTKCSSQFPSTTSVAAASMLSATAWSSRPSAVFVRAAARLMRPSMWTKAGG